MRFRVVTPLSLKASDAGLHGTSHSFLCPASLSVHVLSYTVNKPRTRSQTNNGTVAGCQKLVGSECILNALRCVAISVNTGHCWVDSGLAWLVISSTFISADSLYVLWNPLPFCPVMEVCGCVSGSCDGT